jgi:hypothetical protein
LNDAVCDFFPSQCHETTSRFEHEEHRAGRKQQRPTDQDGEHTNGELTNDEHTAPSVQVKQIAFKSITLNWQKGEHFEPTTLFVDD